MRYLYLSVFILLSTWVYAQNGGNFSCHQAIDIQLGENCFIHSNSESNTESNSSCKDNLKKDIWYHFEANQNSIYSIEATLSEMDSLYNNSITIYSGQCGNLVEVACVNVDEYGFLGETAYLAAEQNIKYYLKISGLEDDFGRVSGQTCIALKLENNTPIASENDICDQATLLVLNDDARTFENINASLEGTYISALERNRADVWFKFVPDVDTDIKIESMASFSHTIGLYEGDCTSLSLLKGNLSGFELSVENLSKNQTYYIQISGLFASLEGEFDIKISSILNENSDNEDCQTSLPYENSCLAFSTLSSSFSGQYPSCLFYPQNDIWFDFTPEQSGTFKLNINTDFLSVVAIYRNECNNLEEITCGSPSTCDGAIDVKNLIANQKYFIQILTNSEYFMNEGGQGCLEIEHISDYYYSPLELEVTTICISENLAKLRIEASNGKGTYSFNGNRNGEELAVGSAYFVEVTDENGCQQIAHGVVTCNQAENECELYYDLDIIDYDCSTQTGGSAVVTVYGESDFSIIWPSGEPSNTLSNLAPGQYSVKIQNLANGTSCTELFEIIERVDSYQLFYADIDNDNYGDPNDFIRACSNPSGYVSNFNDCNDSNDQINPDMNENVYNGIDDDCDPTTLDDDLDQDGFVLADDCDDTNPEINPDQVETPYNGIDDDCDIATLDDDLDQDGFVLADDCDDTNPDINPDQSEEPYNGIDDDCDITTLDDDLDQDGFVLADDCDDTNPDINPDQSEEPYNGIDDDCDIATLDDDLDQDGFVLADDCDDTNPDINPDQTEEPYNGIDDDCDIATLDDDLDQDGFVLADDCDDTNPDINPDAVDIPANGIDEDCDGVDLITSVHDLTSTTINIYPNPAIDIINIEVEEEVEFQSTLFDLNGKLILSLINNSSIDVNLIPSGIYLLKIQDLETNKTIIEKVMIGH